MFRILVVEDQKDTLSQLQILLSDHIPESQVDTAADVATGVGRIREAFESRKPYVAAVLDFKLPTTVGENAEVDTTICQELARLHPDTLVGHITAYPDEEAIKNHLQKVHLREVGPRAFFLSKLEVDWPEQLVKRLRSFLFSRRIEAQFDQFFAAPAGEPGGRYRPRYAGGLTHPWAALSREIIAHWDEIEEALRGKIRQHVWVDKAADGSLRVSLLHPEQPHG